MAQLFSVASIVFDDSAWPLLRITFQGATTDEEFEAYLRRYDDDYLSRNETYAVNLITVPELGMAKAAHAKMQGKWIAEREETIGRLCAGLAFVLQSPLQRGVLRAMLSIQGFPCPYKTFKTVSEGEVWLNEQLASKLDRAGAG